MRGGPATLADIIDQRLDVFCWCNRCGHWAVLPAEGLARQMGPAMAVPRVGARLVCSGCSSRDVSTRPDWPSGGVVSRHG
ncbi:MAG: hypothetical protein M0006_13130 [Magnetospirillum sp.]|nr:hypothetical protein [Magnetospirillum sp.]